jgi:hypothetical protein
MKKVFISVATLSLAALFAPSCAMDAVTDAGDPELNAALHQALADESFQATIALLQNKGVEVDLSAATLLREDGDDSSLAVSFPLMGNDQGELAYELGSDGIPKAIVKEIGSQEEPGPGSCGNYNSSDSCSNGPWPGGLSCKNGGQLYKYDAFSRKWYTNGRKITHQYTWYSCTWMAMPTNCNSTC